MEQTLPCPAQQTVGKREMLTAPVETSRKRRVKEPMRNIKQASGCPLQQHSSVAFSAITLVCNFRKFSATDVLQRSNYHKYHICKMHVKTGEDASRCFTCTTPTVREISR